MKKQLTAILISMSLAAGAVPALAYTPLAAEVTSTRSAELAELTSVVKSKLDIPSEYTKFTINRSTYDDDKVSTYELVWSTDDGEYKEISAECDASGHITNYWDSFYDFDRKELVTDLKKDVVNVITGQVMKMLPECFADEKDTYKIYSDIFNMDGSGIVRFARFKDGVKVWDNDITADFRKVGDEYKVYHLASNHDYDAVFGENTDGENIKERYRELAKSELCYNIVYRNGKREPALRYTVEDAPFMDPVTGEAIENDIEERYPYPYANDEEYSTASGAAALKEDALTKEELEEIDKMSGLKTPDEVEAYLRTIPELNISDDMSLKYKRIYKSDEKYYMQLNFTNGKDGSEFQGMGITVNAESGKLYNIYGTASNYLSSNYEPMTDEELKGVSGGEEFLKKYADGFEGYILTDKTGCKNNGDYKASEEYTKIVNGIPFKNDVVWISYNTETNQVYEMSVSREKAEGEFPNPADAVSAEEAFDTLISVYPITPVFVKSEGIYKKAYIIEERYSYVDAIENQVVMGWSNEPVRTENEYSYIDISGHWAESIIKNFAQFDIGFGGNSFCPDDEITAGDFAELAGAVMGIYDIYPARYNNENQEDFDAAAPVTRENAVKYIIEKSGYGKIAGLKDIFVTRFDDEADIEPENIGYCAIAKGMGIISGSDGKFMPKRNITRAEAAAMLYKFKLNQK